MKDSEDLAVELHNPMYLLSHKQSKKEDDWNMGKFLKESKRNF
jgi:hypothetical protein